MATRWGIVGVGKIGSDFATCTQNLSKDKHKIVAVASRSLERSQKFSERFSIPSAYGSYEELSKDPNVEVAYICCDHSTHFSAAKMMLEAGKHVLCEKPMGINEKQVEELIKVAKNEKKFLMEGVWSRFFPAYFHVQKLINDNLAGKPIHVQANFGLQSFLKDVKSREGKEISVTLDIGVYVLQICNFVFKNSKPKIVLVSGGFNDEGADDNAIVMLDYGQGRFANVIVSWRMFMENSATISCDKSYIKILPPFHCPTKVEVNRNIIEFPLPDVGNSEFNFENSAGLTYEIEEVRKCLIAGLLESPGITHEESKDLAMILTEIRRQIGIKSLKD